MSADFHESQRHSKDIDGHFDHVGIIGQTLDLVISQVAGLILDILLGGYVMYRGLEKLTVSIIFGVGLPYLALSYRFASRARRSIRKTVKENDELIAMRRDMLARWRTIQDYRAIDHELVKYKTAHREVLKGYRENATLKSTCTTSQDFCYKAGFCIVLLLYVFKQLDSRSLTLLLFWNRLLYPFSQLGSLYYMIQSNIGEGEGFRTFLGQKPTIQDADDAVPLELTTAPRIQFTKVWLSYSHGKPILKGINFKFQKGLHAIVGPSGGGKTSVIQLISRHYDPSEGDIFIGDKNIRKVHIESLRDYIGTVTPVTASETLVNGRMLVSRPLIASWTTYDILMTQVFLKPVRADSAYLIADVIKAARLAHIHERILNLPNKYKTSFQDIKLSEGEYQRLQLARVVCKKPKILLLDEVTSGLDSLSQDKIKYTIRELSQECTVVVVAHRLSTVKEADSITVLVSGEIVEVGSHDELMEKKGKYFEMWNMEVVE